MIAPTAYGVESICTLTISSRAAQAAWLSQAIERCGIEPAVVPGFVDPQPRPVRSAWLDPEARLKRSQNRVSKKIREELEKLRREHEEEQKLKRIVDMFEGEKK